MPRLSQHRAVYSLGTGFFAHIPFDIPQVSGFLSFQLAVALYPAPRLSALARLYEPKTKIKQDEAKKREARQGEARRGRATFHA